jgi:hypothetical protein
MHMNKIKMKDSYAWLWWPKDTTIEYVVNINIHINFNRFINTFEFWGSF